MANQINSESRAVTTNSKLKQLRSDGKVPAVVYGQSIETATVAVEQKQVSNILKSNPNAVLQMEIPEQGTHPVMIGEIQRDPVTRNIMHLDFQQIDIKSAISVSIRIDIVGQAKGTNEGGVLQTVLNELEISCLPHLIPTHVSLDVSELGIGDSLTVADVQLPEQVEALTPAEEIVVSVLAPQQTIEEEEEAAEEQAESAEAEASSESEED